MSTFLPLIGSPEVNLGAAELASVADLTRIVLPAQVFFMLGSLLMAVQYAKGKFVVPSLAPIVYNVAIIVGGVLWAGLVGAEATGFAWGALAGAAIGNFGLQAWGARQAGLVWVRRASWRHPDVGEYVMLSIPLMLGQSIAVLDEQFVKVFGNLLGEGSISQLNFAAEDQHGARRCHRPGRRRGGLPLPRPSGVGRQGPRNSPRRSPGRSATPSLWRGRPLLPWWLPRSRPSGWPSSTGVSASKARLRPQRP